jgi:hypothetical protein
MDYSKLIFGGFNDTEALAIEDFVRRGKTLVGEFNTFGSPTEGVARRRLEWIFGAHWTGWAGRFFTDLGDMEEVPVWARRHWRWHYGEEWPHKGPGWLFAHEDTRIFVVKEGPDAYPMALRIKDIRRDDPLMDGVLDEVPFYFWFDVVEAFDYTEVLAKYYFHLKQPGIDLMRKFGLPLVFPCVIRSSRAPLRLYMAGDFTDHRAHRGAYWILGLPWYKKVGRFAEHYRDQTGFFWQFYVPLFQNILCSDPAEVGHGNLRDGFIPVLQDGGVDGRSRDGGVSRTGGGG